MLMVLVFKLTPEGAGPLQSLHWDNLCGGPVTTLQKANRAPTYPGQY